MATAVKIKKEVSASRSTLGAAPPVRKSKFTEFWEKHPNGLLTVIDRRAVLK